MLVAYSGLQWPSVDFKSTSRAGKVVEQDPTAGLPERVARFSSGGAVKNGFRDMAAGNRKYQINMRDKKTKTPYPHQT